MTRPLTIADCRPEVLAFALLMERKLKARDAKNGGSSWKGRPELRSVLFNRLKAELVELQQQLDQAIKTCWRPWNGTLEGLPKGFYTAQLRATSEGLEIAHGVAWDPSADDSERIGFEAADVANYAMMIADICGALGVQPSCEARPGGLGADIVDRLEEIAHVLDQPRWWELLGDRYASTPIAPRQAWLAGEIKEAAALIKALRQPAEGWIG